MKTIEEIAREAAKKLWAYGDTTGVASIIADAIREHEEELQEKLKIAEELLREIRDDEVNAQDECDKYLRDHQPSELSKLQADKARLDWLTRNCFVNREGDNEIRYDFPGKIDLRAAIDAAMKETK